MEKITIGIVTFDRIKLLKRAVSSVLSQSYENYEILIGNDNPKIKLTPKKIGIINSKKVKIFNYKINVGERKNLNFLLKKAKSKYFCWLGDDDFLHKDFFKILIKNFNNKPELIASYSNYSRKKIKLNPKSQKYVNFDKINFLKGFTCKKLRLIGTFGIIKTKYLKKINGINKTGKSFKTNNVITHHYPYCDTLIPIMLSNYGNISWIDHRLVYLNTNQNSVSGKTNDYEAYVSSENYIVNKLKKTCEDIKFSKEYYEIIFNIYEWFLENRFSVIKKRNYKKNFYCFMKYFNDLILLFEKKAIIFSIRFITKNFFKLIKSIINSQR